MTVYNLLAGAKGTPLVPITDGLQIYLDANVTSSYSGSGTTWTDISGNGRNFTWDSVSYNTSGTPKYFDTYGRRCFGPASNSVGITNTSGYTIYLIMYLNSATASSSFKFYSSNGSGSAGRGIFSHTTWTDGIIYFDQGGCCNSDTRTNVSGGTMNVWNIITFRRETNGSTRTIIKNNSTLTTNTNAAANINLSSTVIDLSNTDEYSVWDARLAGFLVYNRGLSDAEITANYNSLKTAYSWIT